MQQLGHIKINGKNIQVLGRNTKFGLSLKIRKESKHLGYFFENESTYLNMNRLLISKLERGFTINI